MIFSRLPILRTLSASLTATALVLCSSGLASAQKTLRILGPGGVEPNGLLTSPFVSQDGSTIVFSSSATNLDPADTNGGVNDIFLYDVASQSIELISKSTAGVQANAFSILPICSSNGDRVVYWSNASNLDPGDTSTDRDVYLYDRTAGTTTLVSPGPVGFDSDEPFISPNGNWIVFLAEAALVPSDTNGVRDVYRYSVATGVLALVSLGEFGAQATVDCTGPVGISNSGQQIVFATASALVAQDLNGVGDVYLRDLVPSTTRRAAGSLDPSSGASSPFISADGEYVAFVSSSPEYIPGDTNGFADVFVWELISDKFSIISRGPSGLEANSASFTPRLSRFGRYVVFTSNATNLTAADTNGVTDVFWVDRNTNTRERVNVATNGSEANGTTGGFPSVSQNGNLVTYQSSSTNLVPGDTVVAPEAMLTWRSSSPTFFCVGKLNTLACLPFIGASGSPSASLTQPFNLTATKIRNNKNGLFFYGLNGPAALPFQGGTLCVSPPLKRTTIMNSQGAVGVDDCSGTYSFDFNAWMQGSNDLNLEVGHEVNGQFWSRDPGSSFGVSLTNGVRFAICP